MTDLKFQREVESLRIALKAAIAKQLRAQKVPHESGLGSALAQDALLLLCKEGLEVICNGSAEDKGRWMQTAAHDAVVRFVRYNTADKRDARRNSPLGARPGGCEHAARDTAPVQEAERNETQRRLAGAMVGLKPEHREVIDLHYLQGWNYAAIARRRGCTPESVMIMAHRAREQMRKRFGHSLEELL